MYMENFTLTKPGYNDGGQHFRIYHAGSAASIAAGTETLRRFLDVISFAGDADYVNALGAALLVRLRNHWIGRKPLIAVNGNKSQCGKGTILRMICGINYMSTVTYQPTDWAMERNVVGALKLRPDTAVVTIDNARLYGNHKYIASGFLESFATTQDVVLLSTGTGKPVCRRNDLVLAFTMNRGSLSTDLANRSIPIQLMTTGNIEDREPEIGDPLEEFLPANSEKIEAELHGMVARWRQAGCPLDTRVKHPFSQCTQVISGILQVSGFEGFLSNYSLRKSSDDPLRKALGLLGACCPDKWLSATEWADQIVNYGFVGDIISKADCDTDAGRARRTGIILNSHRDETFSGETEDERFTVRLEQARRRFEKGDQPSTRYRFVEISREDIPADDDPSDVGAELVGPNGDAAKTA